MNSLKRLDWRRWLVIPALVVIVLLLAFPLRGLVYELIVLPLAYILFLLKLLYQSLDQLVWWVVTIVIVLAVLMSSMLPEGKYVPKAPQYKRIQRGPVESLAASLQKKDHGVYFKWSVANRLGKLAHQILLLREHGKPRSAFAPLTGQDWDPAPEIQLYLEKGLRGSFADYPNKGWGYPRPPVKTPFDQNVDAVVEFLESKQGDGQIRS